MAELADALDLGSSPRGCRFDSCYPHYNITLQTKICKVFCFFINNNEEINTKLTHAEIYLYYLNKIRDTVIAMR